MDKKNLIRHNNLKKLSEQTQQQLLNFKKQQRGGTKVKEADVENMDKGEETVQDTARSAVEFAEETVK